MILRREFLKRMAFAVLASALPQIPLPKKEEQWTEQYDLPTDTARYQHTQYGLGFVVTAEMMEDDLYGAGMDRMVNELKKELEHELILRFGAVV
ncbi:MAG: hypothetical protein AB7V18_19050 [Pyrinomonadaceae bacterium]